MNESPETPHNSDSPEDFVNLVNRSDPPEGATPHPTEVPSAVSFDEQRIFWAARDLRASEATKNFVIYGGAGKSLTVQLFLQSIAPRFRPDRAEPEQLIVFDAKGDIQLLTCPNSLGRTVPIQGD